MSDTNWFDIEQNAKQWIKEAAEKIRQSFHSEIAVGHKAGPNDLVTTMDREIEQFFSDRIHETYPTHRLLSEEGYGDDVSSLDGMVWILDPIDGTMNFVHQQCFFAISVGVYCDGEGMIGLIYDVVGDEMFHCLKGEGAYVDGERLSVRQPVSVKEAIAGLNATWIINNHRIDPNILSPLVKIVRGTRSYGTAAIELAYIAAGRLDAYFSMRLAPWDFAAGLVLLEEVGAKVTTMDGQPVDLLHQNSIFAAETNLHQKINEDYIQKGIREGLYIQTRS